MTQEHLLETCEQQTSLFPNPFIGLNPFSVLLQGWVLTESCLLALAPGRCAGDPDRSFLPPDAKCLEIRASPSVLLQIRAHLLLKAGVALGSWCRCTKLPIQRGRDSRGAEGLAHAETHPLDEACAALWTPGSGRKLIPGPTVQPGVLALPRGTGTSLLCPLQRMPCVPGLRPPPGAGGTSCLRVCQFSLCLLQNHVLGDDGPPQDTGGRMRQPVLHHRSG